jgi:hypothetical protein
MPIGNACGAQPHAHVLYHQDGCCKISTGMLLTGHFQRLTSKSQAGKKSQAEMAWHLKED